MNQDSQTSNAPLLPVPPGMREPLPAPTAPTGPAAETLPSPEQAPGGGGTPSTDLDKRLAFADQTHQYIRDYIRQADQKAAFFFTVSTALLAFLYKAGISSRWLKPLLRWNVLDMAAFLAMMALAMSAIVALLVIIPRTPGSRRGYLFWEAIAEYDTSRRYADDLVTLSIPTLLQVKSEHCHELAGVCRRKYKWLRIALWIGMLGLTASVVVFLFATPVTV